MENGLATRVGCTLVFVIAGIFAAGAQPRELGRLTGLVIDPTGAPLPGVTVSVLDSSGRSMVSVTTGLGQFDFEGVEAGTCHLSAALVGYVTYSGEVLVTPDRSLEPMTITMQLTPVSESVVIREPLASNRIAPPAASFDPRSLDALPLATDRFQEALPLVPGVVRDPEGRISFNGSRPSQSMLLVNGANATDPVTGEFSVELPLRAIEEVEVNTLPYSAEYGRLTGAVARVTTRGGSDEFDFDVGNLWPRPNFRDGKIKGWRSFVPQIQVSGPLKKGRAWFSQGVAYRFVRTRAFDVSEGPDETLLENFDTFTQLDFRLSDDHRLTTTFSFFPVEVENLGLNALTTEASSPDFESGGWNLAVSERAFWARSLLETVLSIKSFNVKVDPKSEQIDARLTPDGLRQNYFNQLDRESLRIELASSLTTAPGDLFGRHVVKLGVNLAHSSFTGLDRSLPIDLFVGDVQTHRIEFDGAGEIDGSDTQLALFVQDRYHPHDRVGVDVGLRYDFDRLLGKHQLGPRLSAAIAVDPRGRTVVKAGWGVFFDHVFLHSDGYERYQKRIETRFDPTGAPVGPSVTFVPRIAPQGLRTPRSTSWNTEVSRMLSDDVQLRVNYRERRGRDEMIVDRLTDGTAGTMLLSSDGRSLTRQLDVTMKVSRNDNELFWSYVRSRSTGDLNHFGELYRNHREPLFFDNERSLSGADVPHRVLMWGIWRLPKDVILSPGAEWRSGFPYTVLGGSYQPVGERNRGGRYPNFLSVDLRLTKGVRVKGKNVRIGFQLRNIGSRFNPRDVIRHTGSIRFGDFLNGVDMGFSLRFALGS